ncbi:hypothetical protein GQ55_3G087000 [Panicum hallii var. hallii]|uniref:Uncharacterized protein n=1 Tax=Panicum hallii var. hallii TaxID=1504633 RepID=A0A2T7E777_9POAL|nr:hypothetical protein GQ55_3G087000 [Panicum hallii var. hallii]
MLGVLPGVARCGCLVCGAELAVDPVRLPPRYFLSAAVGLQPCRHTRRLSAAAGGCSVGVLQPYRRAAARASAVVLGGRAPPRGATGMPSRRCGGCSSPAFIPVPKGRAPPRRLQPWRRPQRLGGAAGAAAATAREMATARGRARIGPSGLRSLLMRWTWRGMAKRSAGESGE